MPTIKYHYNPKTFRYERARLSVADVFWYVSGLAITSVLLCGAMIVVYDSFVESETKKALLHENRILEKHKPILQNQLASIKLTLSKLQEEDKLLHARLFDSNQPESFSVPASVSKEQAIFADPSDFRSLLSVIKAKSEMLTEKSAKSNASFGNQIRITKDRLNLIGSIPSIQPVANAQLDLLVSGFGERINPFHKGKYHHPGVDFAAPRGSPVFVTAPGRVVALNRTSLEAGYGNYIDVNHGNGFVTRYAHLDEIKVSKGEKVEKGKIIGTVGSSGGSIAPHLHYEVIRDREQVDPVAYLMEGLTSEQHHNLLNLSSKINQSLD